MPQRIEWELERYKKGKLRAGEADRDLYRKSVKNREVGWQEYTTYLT